MESIHNLTLDEDVYEKLPAVKKPIYILEWFRHLDKFLVTAHKANLKECQKQLVEQLLKQLFNNPGPPTRKLIGQCLATLFSVGDTFLLFDAVNKCNDILKNKDDSPSFLPTRLAAIVCIGSMYEKLGRLMGRSYEETVNLLLKSLKNAESQSRCEIFITLEKIVAGMGVAASNVHRDIFKAIRHGIIDRLMIVRCNSAMCLKELIKHATFLFTTELESVFSLCFRALEGSNYEVRCAIADVLGFLIATTQKPNKSLIGKNRLASLEEVLNLLASGFLKGGIGFLKSGPGEIIKGGSVSREIRVGVTHAYVVLVYYLGNSWFDKNMPFFLAHILDLLSNPKSASTHMDSVYSRRCVGYILRSVLSKHLSQKAQIKAVEHLVSLINRYANFSRSNTEIGNDQFQNSTKESPIIDTSMASNVIVCALLEMGYILQDLGTCSTSILTDPSIGLIETIASLLVNSSPPVRLAGGWCMRCISVSSPSQLTGLIERSLERLETMKTSPETIHGHSFALSGLLASASMTILGIPHNRGKLIFSIAEDLLRTASQNSRLSLQRTQSGWQLIGGVMALGPSVVRGLLPRMLLLWKNSFPRSAKELESEKARGDAFTWQITLENRAGALSAMSSFLSSCDKLITEEVIRRLLIPIESAISMLTALGSVFRTYGPPVKACTVVVRLRLYEVLLLLPGSCYDSSYSPLLRLLISEFTLAENAANTTTTLLRNFCHSNDDILIGSWIQETDHKLVEDQLQPHSSSGSGALEHDVTALYRPLEKNLRIPSPLALGCSVINESCLVFSHIFCFVTSKHRLLMLNHFQECIKHAKAARQEAVQMNILTALVGALKSLADNKCTIITEEVKKTFTSLLMSMLSHNNPLIRCGAAQGLGRLCQVVGDARFVAEVAQICFDKLKSARDAYTRTGHSLALGCLQRYVGSLGSYQHLNTSISILLALSQDSASPIVQVWSLHALAIIADSGGPMFRSYVEPTLAQSLKLLVSVPFYHCDVIQSIGRLLSALINTVGPELQNTNESVSTIRSNLLIATSIMQCHTDGLVLSEAIGCLQQLHMFAPSHVDLENLVPMLCSVLNNGNLFLRRAAIACLHQLSQREAREVCDHANRWVREMKEGKDGLKNLILDHGLLGILFYLMDHETDNMLINDIIKIATSLIHSLAIENLYNILSLCKEILSTSDTNSTNSSPDKDFEEEGDDDESQFKAKDDVSNHTILPPKWRTKVFATQILCRIISACEVDGDPSHFDLSLAKEKSKCGSNYLVLHLSDLIRMSFMAATSDCDDLRLEGLKALQLIIDKFSKVSEPEFPEHIILEQYQAQVGAALRPAFSSDTPPHITAIACHVCSAWIGSGVARDLADLRRVHQLLVASLNKLSKDSNSRLYNESAYTLEKLAILKAWAEVYIVAMEQTRNEFESHNEDENLLSLVEPELKGLSKNWLLALKDHALLMLPEEFSTQLPHDGGAFYTSDTIEAARPIYRSSWPPILHAAALWLCSKGFIEYEHDSNNNYFHLLFGICMEALCNPRSSEPLSYVIICLKSLKTLLEYKYSQKLVGSDSILCIELSNVLHRLLLTRESPYCGLLILDIAKLIVVSRLKELERKRKHLNLINGEEKNGIEHLGEGGETGDIDIANSVVYALLEVCLCVLVRQLPELCPSLANTPGLCTSKRDSKSCEYRELISSSLELLCSLLELCSPKGSVVILPSVLHLMTGVLRETSSSYQQDKQIFDSVTKCFSSVGLNKLAKNPICKKNWISLLQSCVSSILDICKSSDEENKLDDAIEVSIIGVFIVDMPSEVLAAPNLQYPCINLLKQAMQSDNKALVIKCFETLKLIFEVKDDSIKIGYINALAPKMIELLGSEINEVAFSQTITKNSYDLIIIGLKNFEILSELAQPEKRINILSLYLPLLVTLLSESVSSKASYRYNLHEYAFNQLINIGPRYPNEFKTIIGSVGMFRNKLENAVKNQSNLISSSSSSSSEIKPKSIIKLKTDFSNFSD